MQVLMKTLNLINPAKSDVKYEYLCFSDNQPHIKLTPGTVPGDEILIITRLSNPTDILLLLFVTEVLRNNFRVQRIALEVSYLLTARMDRRMNDGEPTSLRVIASLLNLQNYTSVTIFDPHSANTELLVDRCICTPQVSFIGQVTAKIPGMNSSILFIAPDKGAEKKVTELAKAWGHEVILCEKNRDPKTGQLFNPTVHASNLQEKSCLIIDDICDGGGTFIQLYPELKKKNAGKVYLAISHGIFSKGLEPLKMFEQVYTTNSFKERSSVDNLTVIKLW